VTLIARNVEVISHLVLPVDKVSLLKSTTHARHANIRHSKVNLTTSNSNIAHSAMEKSILQNHNNNNQDK
jgi:hypothetical protein